MPRGELGRCCSAMADVCERDWKEKEKNKVLIFFSFFSFSDLGPVHTTAPRRSRGLATSVERYDEAILAKKQTLIR
jgi:hypothetical protein